MRVVKLPRLKKAKAKEQPSTGFEDRLINAENDIESLKGHMYLTRVQLISEINSKIDELESTGREYEARFDILDKRIEESNKLFLSGQEQLQGYVYDTGLRLSERLKELEKTHAEFIEAIEVLNEMEKTEANIKELSALLTTQIEQIAKTNSAVDHILSKQPLETVTKKLHYCASPNCPGYEFRASEMGHPENTCGPTDARNIDAIMVDAVKDFLSGEEKK